MGKYLHEFQSESEFQTFVNSDLYIEPFVASTNIDGEWRMYYNQDNGGGDEDLTIPLTFEITSDGEIAWMTRLAGLTATIEYSKNGGEWIEITSDMDMTVTKAITTSNGNVYYPVPNNMMQYSGETGVVWALGAPLQVGAKVYGSMMDAMMGMNPLDTITEVENESVFAPRINVVSGDTVQFRGDNPNYGGYGMPTNGFTTTCNFKLSGNIMSLIDSDGFATATTLTNGYAFSYLFQECSGLTDASKLLLPATTLTEKCYCSMFYSCPALTAAPALPATTLAEGCYMNMFYACSSLSTAPALPATTLANSCYENMFRLCIGLTTAPALPATTLVEGCYKYMFNSCINLVTPPAISATTLANYCCQSMFHNCSSLTTAPALPATTLAYGCYAYMFYECTSLTGSPVMSATTLAPYCCQNMFQNCSNLTTAPALPATTLAQSCYVSMFYGCESLTTAPELPATTLAYDCYDGMFAGCTGLTTAPELPATALTENCYLSMFEYCTSLTTAPELPTTALEIYCYANMFYGCTGLTTAPELPAATLVEGCYQSMFRECTNLNYIKCLATSWQTQDSTTNWVSNVASSGTFVKAAGMEDWTTGNNGIPENWTVQDAD